MVRGNPSPAQQPLEFSVSALEYVSGIVIATILAARENPSIIREGSIPRSMIKYDPKDDLTKILREDGRLAEKHMAFLFHREDASIVEPEISLKSLGSYTFHQLAIFNTTKNPTEEGFKDLICNLYDHFDQKSFRYSMGISSVWFQEQKIAKEFVLPSDVFYQINLEPRILRGINVRIKDGLPEGLIAASGIVLRQNPLPLATVYRAKADNQVVLAYSSKTEAYHLQRDVGEGGISKDGVRIVRIL